MALVGRELQDQWVPTQTQSSPRSVPDLCPFCMTSVEAILAQRQPCEVTEISMVPWLPYFTWVCYCQLLSSLAHIQTRPILSHRSGPESYPYLKAEMNHGLFLLNHYKGITDSWGELGGDLVILSYQGLYQHSTTSHIIKNASCCNERFFWQALTCKSSARPCSPTPSCKQTALCTDKV